MTTMTDPAGQPARTTLHMDRPDARPKVTVLTGFLGAGKTTLVNHLLSTDHGYRIAVIVNEVGEIGIDGDLIVSSDEEVIEMANGCVCCTLSVRSDLTTTLRKLLERPDPPDYVLIEASGLADPVPVTQALFVEGLIDRLALDGIVTIVDAKHIGRHLDEFGPDRSESRAVDQIVCADRIVLNKTDLVTEEACLDTERRIHALNNTAPLIKASYSRVEPGRILGIGAFDRSRMSEGEGLVDLDSTFVHSNDPGIEVTSIEVAGELDRSRLLAWLEELVETRSADIYRLKGILAVAGEPDRVVLQGVHRMFEMYSGGPWPDRRRSRLVIIGRDIDGDATRSGLEGCLAP